MKRFKRVAVLMGGPSTEREVSLASGAAVVDGLRQAGYAVTPVDVRGEDVDLPAGTDAVFIALHGAFGEDGTVQALLDARGMPYTGSGAVASRSAMDKLATKTILSERDIPVPPHEVLTDGALCDLRPPVVVKPAAGGSSIGIHLVRREPELAAAVADARRFGGAVIAEPYIEGRELTVGIVAGEALPVIEILAPGKWYDYGAKYKGGTRYLMPAPIPEFVAEACRRYALATFEALGCRGMGRVDFRLDASEKPYVLETNSIPGFTPTSLLPKAAAAAGIGFPELCDRILTEACHDG